MANRPDVGADWCERESGKKVKGVSWQYTFLILCSFPFNLTTQGCAPIQEKQLRF